MCSIGVFIALAHGAPLMRAFNSSRRLEPVSVASISPRTLRRKLLLANLRPPQPLGGCDARPPFGRAGTGRKSAVEAAKGENLALRGPYANLEAFYVGVAKSPAMFAAADVLE